MKKINITHFPPLNYARSEAVNTLYTNLSFSGESVRKIMITSSHANEGKSTVAMELMRKMAELGHSVVLVDTDLRRSVMDHTYQFEYADSTKLGLAHYLSGQAEIDDVVYETDIVGAYVVPVGRTVSNPLPLLNTDRFGALVQHLASQADYVLIDTAPIGMVIDGAEIAKSCDGTLIVVNYNSVHRKELQQVAAQLKKTGCPILGVALYAVDYDNYMNKNYYYKSKYGYGYGYYNNADGEAGTGKHHSRKKKQEA